MARAISRDTFDEGKDYVGVHLQQGRPILDADWNEAQDITDARLRRLGELAVGEGSFDVGFAIEPLYQPPKTPMFQDVPSLMTELGSAIPFFLNFPDVLRDDFEHKDGWVLSPAQGNLQIAHDDPFAGTGFLRLSGHNGPVTAIKTLSEPVDLHAFDVATFRFRLNHPVPGTLTFFLQDANSNRVRWPHPNAVIAPGQWLPGFAAPLDTSMRFLTKNLPSVAVGQPYGKDLYAYPSGLTCELIAGQLPDGLKLGLALGNPFILIPVRSISGVPSPAAKTSTFTLQLSDGQRKVSREFTIEVGGVATPPRPHPTDEEELAIWRSAGQPVDLTQITGYGFEVYQSEDTANPLVWDFDDLRVGSVARHSQLAPENFIIRGPQLPGLLNRLTVEVAMELTRHKIAPREVRALMAEHTRLGDRAGLYHLAGTAFRQKRDILYADQADPNDPPLSPPEEGAREDTVYLDTWTEPVTYAEDPDIRDVALGGPDTATRNRMRQRIRVIQGANAPTDRGIGAGRLETSGQYTAKENRLYRVEIDTPGPLGTATFRWSDDNASTIQRLIEPAPNGSTRVVVEDASGLQVGDHVLISKEFGEETHQIGSILGNVVELKDATGTQLAARPAAARTDGFADFALADRPTLQRWNGFAVQIPMDADDPAVSTAIPLNDGVQVRFSGSDLRKGDYWQFTTRYLTGDEATGAVPRSKIEELHFQPARGVLHHYTPLAVIIRDANLLTPDKVRAVTDRRRRQVDPSPPVYAALPDWSSDDSSFHLGGIRLPEAPGGTRFAVTLYSLLEPSSPPPASVHPKLSLRALFYTDEMTDPVNEQDTGRLSEDESIWSEFDADGIGTRITVGFVNPPPDTSELIVPPAASVQIFAQKLHPEVPLTIRLLRNVVVAQRLEPGTAMPARAPH